MSSSRNHKLFLKRCNKNRYEKPSYSSMEEHELFLDHDSDLHNPYYLTPISIDNLSRKSSSKISKSFLKQGMYNFVSSCNGLLHFFGHDGKGVVWNPKTDEVKFIPLDNIGPPHVDFRYQHESHITVVCGFGFDSESGDYKVIKFVEYAFEDDDVNGEEGGYRVCRGMETQVMLYSLKNECWKLLPQHDCPAPDSGVYLDGCFYWLQYGHPYRALESFDFSKESFSNSIRLNYISETLDYKYSAHLVNFDGSLGIVAFLGSYFELWAMNADGCWVKQFYFNVHLDHEDTREGVNVQVSPLGFWNGLLFLVTGSGRIYVYDHANSSGDQVKKIGTHGNPDRMQLISYVETTVSPHIA
ncbi:hypothetical protein C2S51_026721 [Perilla frutescens var. frutescens]|nr:hypothetical protein C2S51_026721 [Perilla frutescens var. frutescens]